MKRILRVLILTYQGDEAGSTNSITYLSKGLADKGHIVYMGCREESLIYKRLVNTNVNVLAFPFKKKWDFHCARYLARVVSEKSIDIINAQSSWDRAVAILSKIFFNMRASLVFTRRQMPLTWFFENWAYSFFVDRFIAVSAAVRDALIQKGTDARKVSVVYNGLSWERISGAPSGGELSKIKAEYGISNKDKVIGVISRLKEHHILIRALSRVKTRVKVLFIGIDYNAGLDRLAREIGLRHEIYYTGFKKNILSYYRILDVSVLPSTTEGLSQTILESLALGVPVICSSAGGNPEVIKEGFNGQLFPPRDYRLLAAQIENVLNDQELRKRLIINGRESVASEFSIDKTIAGTEKVYCEAIQGRVKSMEHTG